MKTNELKELGADELAARRAEAEGEFADVEAQLAGAQAQVDDITAKDAAVYTLDLTKNIGAESFRSDAGRIDKIAQVFPLIFFLVAALVSLTTMTRMVDEDRVLIGTYKALGYSKAKISSKYLLYAAVASGVGSAIGIVALSIFLPWFIMGAYAIIYPLPCRPVPIDAGIALASAGLGMGITVAATWAAVSATLREKPSELMLPRAPKAGKRILLERVRPVWRRMSFSWKVTARNLFRYKRRLCMTIIGIAGCTALLLTGLGLQNAINDIIDKQFGELYHYNTTVRMDTDATDAQRDAVVDRVAADSQGDRAWISAENAVARLTFASWTSSSCCVSFSERARARSTARSSVSGASFVAKYARVSAWRSSRNAAACRARSSGVVAQPSTRAVRRKASFFMRAPPGTSVP